MSYHWAYACAYAALRDSHVCLRGTLGARRASADLTAGAYAELTWSLRAGTHKNHLEFLMSDMEVGLFSCGVWTVCVRSAIRAWIVYVCVELDCSLVLALLRGVAHVFIMYFFKACAWLTQKVSLLHRQGTPNSVKRNRWNMASRGRKAGAHR